MSTFNNTDLAAFKDVWVFCEQRQGKLMPTDFELISEGRKLADELGVKLCGLLLGDNIEGVANELGGTIFLDTNGRFNMSGGPVTGGRAPSSYCCYFRGKVLLTNDASVEWAYIAQNTSQGMLLKDHPLIDAATIGLKGSPTNIFKSFTPPQKGAGMMLEGADKDTCDKLAGILAKKHII